MHLKPSSTGLVLMASVAAGAVCIAIVGESHRVKTGPSGERLYTMCQGFRPYTDRPIVTAVKVISPDQLTTIVKLLDNDPSANKDSLCHGPLRAKIIYSSGKQTQIFADNLAQALGLASTNLIDPGSTARFTALTHNVSCTLQPQNDKNPFRTVSCATTDLTAKPQPAAKRAVNTAQPPSYIL